MREDWQAGNWQAQALERTRTFVQPQQESRMNSYGHQKMSINAPATLAQFKFGLKMTRK
jgi:hypothetical protein